MILAGLPAYARDFGVRGHQNQIIEQPFLKMIHERLQKVDMEKERQKMEKIAKERIHKPLPLENIMPAVQSRTFYYDPTYMLDEDAILPCGKILQKAGTKVNPLEHMELNRRLFFIDSRDKKQVEWLKAKLIQPLAGKEEQVEDRVILVGGLPLELEEELGINIYFDQQGSLTSKFGINYSPAVVEQEVLMLRIEEGI